MPRGLGRAPHLRRPRACRCPVRAGRLPNRTCPGRSPSSGASLPRSDLARTAYASCVWRTLLRTMYTCQGPGGISNIPVWRVARLRAAPDPASVPQRGMPQGVPMRKTMLLALAMSSVALLAACSSSGASGLTGKGWQLTAFTEKVPAFQGVVPPADQAKYAITFDPDGTFTGTADCNEIAGTYKTAGSNGITITPGVSTMAMCSEASLGFLFVHSLGTAKTFAIAGEQLTLTLTDDGTMTFAVGARRRLDRPQRRDQRGSRRIRHRRPPRRRRPPSPRPSRPPSRRRSRPPDRPRSLARARRRRPPPD